MDTGGRELSPTALYLWFGRLVRIQWALLYSHGFHHPYVSCGGPSQAGFGRHVMHAYSWLGVDSSALSLNSGVLEHL